jgi:hypothetical protein
MKEKEKDFFVANDGFGGSNLFVVCDHNDNDNVVFTSRSRSKASAKCEQLNN